MYWAPVIPIMMNLTYHYWYHKYTVRRVWYYNELDIPLLVPQVRSFQGIGFQPRSRINNHFDIFLCSSYVTRRLFTNRIAAKIEMEVRCA